MRELLGQWWRRAPAEPEFLLFDSVADIDGLVVDIGANRGHCAISILRRTRRLRVLSLEPNPEFRWILLLLWALHPWRFRFRLAAASATGGDGALLVPVGKTDLSTQASLDPAEFSKDYVVQRLLADGHIPGNFRTIQVQMLAIDALALQPEVIKLDVEGFELQALQGLVETLQRCKPAVIIELNNRERWTPLLQQCGYCFYTFEHGRLQYCADEQQLAGLNVVCLHPESEGRVSSHWRELAHWTY